MCRLRTEHKLKHSGRLLYTMFLKGAGVKVEEQLELWEKEFRVKMTKDQYDKKRCASTQTKLLV